MMNVTNYTQFFDFKVVLTENDVIVAMRRTGAVGVRALVVELKKEFKMAARNQEIFRTVLRKVSVHKKCDDGTTTVELMDNLK